MHHYIAWSMFPLIMSLFVGLLGWGYAGGISLDTLVMTLTVLNVVTLVFLEQLFPRNSEVRLWKDRQTPNDIAHGIVSTFLGAPTGRALGLVVVAWVGPLIGGSFLWPHTWPFWIQVVLVFLLDSIPGYWVHRAQHRFSALWWFHSIHHDARQLHIFKSGRTHLGDDGLSGLVTPLAIILCGAPTDFVILVGMYQLFGANLAHSNVDQRFFPWMHYIFPTADNHRIHHAEERRLQDSNYSGPAPFLDFVFRTFRHPKDHPVQKFGIKGSPVPAGFFGQIVFPFLILFGLQRYAPSE